MPDWVKTALTRKIRRKGAKDPEDVIELVPSKGVLLIVKFVVAMTVCLSGLQIVHLAVLHSWNSEIFAGITGMIGTVTGVLIGHHT